MTNTRRRVKAKNKTKAKAPKKATPREQHIAAIQADKARLEALTPVGTRRIVASFPAVEELLDLLGWLVDATDPTAAIGVDTQRVIVTQSPSDDDGIERAASAVARFVGIQHSTNRALEDVVRVLRDKVEANDHDRWKPTPNQCWVRSCPKRGLRQAWDQPTCAGCGRSFYE